jgi:hypothetical protein
MTRAQKIAIAVAMALLLVLGGVAGALIATSGDDEGGTSAPSASTPSEPASSEPPPEPVTVRSIAYDTGPGRAGGWETQLTLTFDGDPAAVPSLPASGSGSLPVTFDRPVTLPDDVLAAANNDGDPFLVDLAWDDEQQVLTVQLEAYPAVSSTEAGFTSDGRATVGLIRMPTPKISNGCIQIDKPAPYTKLYGNTVVRGQAELFEAGPMTIVARVPGKGTTTTKAMTSEGGVRVPFQKEITLPLIDAPAEGYVAAYEPSAKDGSEQCLVKVPVFMSPGG